MAKKSFLTALFIIMAVLGVEAQTNKVYKADTVIDGNGNKIITVYSRGSFAEGNGNIVTRDIDVAAFKEISVTLPATVNYKVADNYSCRVTLDENLFEWVDIYLKGDCLRVEMVKTFQQSDVKPTKFLIELTAPTLEEISLLGSGDFNFITPYEAKELKIKLTGSGDVVFEKTANIHDFDVDVAGSGNVLSKEFHADYMDISIAGSGKMVCEYLQAERLHSSVAGSGDVFIKDGKVKKANLTVAGSGSIEVRCQMESMDYSVAGTGSISYPGDVKAVGTVVGGKIHKIWGTENNKKKSCDEKPQ
ncbi:MAG: DUF2807 domain-containing protein [Bacteroidales bacterium]|nr:DUF2807 domain-containing protein [Bacteroidales bacterium]